MPEYRLERDVKRAVQKLLAAQGWFWWMPPANGFGKSNVDINALRDGQFLAIETKFGDNKATVLQRQYLDKVRTHGGIGLVVSDTTLPDFARWLDAYPGLAVPETLL